MVCASAGAYPVSVRVAFSGFKPATSDGLCAVTVIDPEAGSLWNVTVVASETLGA